MRRTCVEDARSGISRHAAATGASSALLVYVEEVAALPAKAPAASFVRRASVPAPALSG